MNKGLYINKGILRKNLAVVRSRLSSANVLAVLKSDAYGLGLVPMAKFYREEGVRRFGVGNPSEGSLLRREGFTSEEIFLMRPTCIPEEINTLLDNNIIATTASQESALALSGIAESRSTVAETYLEIDCGLGRYGFLPSETAQILNIFSYMQNIAVSGIYTHLPTNVSKREAEHCIERFESVLAMLSEKKIEINTISALGSTALFKYPKLPHYDIVRVGAAITGRVPGRTGLTKVGVVKAAISEIRWIPPGNKIAGKTKFRKPVRIGLVPVGYAAGYSMKKPTARSLLDIISKTNGKVFLEGGKEVKALGLSGQNHIVLDLTKTDATAGNIVNIEVDPLFAGSLSKYYI